jgi:DNA-binding NarL/FixJ family response regulator
MKRARSWGPLPGLTDREFDVLEALAQGWDTDAIAVRLGLSPKTVRNNVSNVMVKLSARDRAGAVLMATEHGVGGA